MIVTKVGDVFGLLTVKEPKGRDSYSKFMWLCACTCGTETVVRDNNLRQGKVESCSCLRRQLTSERNTKHGFGSTPEAQAWRDMKKRCLNPEDKNYHNYGGRGITVAAEWVDDFLCFLSDVGSRPNPKSTLDRVDNSKGYCPGNVRWVSMQRQQRNKRVNLLVAVGGVTKTAVEWAEEYGLCKPTATYRIHRALKLGIPMDEVLSCPTTPDAFKKLQTKYGHHPY